MGNNNNRSDGTYDPAVTRPRARRTRDPSTRGHRDRRITGIVARHFGPGGLHVTNTDTIPVTTSGRRPERYAVPRGFQYTGVFRVNPTSHCTG